MFSAAPSAPLAVRNKNRQENPLRDFAPFAVRNKNRQDAKNRQENSLRAWRLKNLAFLRPSWLS